MHLSQSLLSLKEQVLAFLIILFYEVNLSYRNYSGFDDDTLVILSGVEVLQELLETLDSVD